ncbi:MAG: acyl carrier protein [Prevotellaceae bacterium]|jgi:acyl carrier protein|nr:acyl carrier protein [Prevotellaceae bacterium]
MDRDEILKQLALIFEEVLKQPGLKIDYNMSADDIDGWDSLSNMTIISEIEKKWNVHFKLRDIVRMKNIGDMIDVIIRQSR